MFGYHGLIRGPITLQFDKDVSIPLLCLKVVDHGEPLLLLGADILRGGRPAHYWCFESLNIGKGLDSESIGTIGFRK